MEKNERTSWENDFAEFLATDSATISDAVSERVLERIHADLHPSAIKIFGKLSLIQFGVGLGSLLFCPQFGISLTSSLGLKPYAPP